MCGVVYMVQLGLWTDLPTRRIGGHTSKQLTEASLLATSDPKGISHCVQSGIN